MDGSENAIETEKITKKFGDNIAVNEVSIKVKKGEIFGLLGPNGAGKTTLISMLVTMKRPTGGRAIVNGFDVKLQPAQVRKSIGIVFQDPTLDDELTAYENLEMHYAMYGGDGGKARETRISDVINAVELADKLHAQVKTYSGGMKRRLEIARGLLHYPDVLFLDEPTIGLDPQTRKHIWEYIKKLKEEHSITVVLTTHYLDEADSLCDRIAIIDHGKIVASGTPQALKDSMGGDVIELEGEAKGCSALGSSLKKIDWVKDIKASEGKMSLRVEHGDKKIPELLALCNRLGGTVTSVNLRKPTLDDVFISYTGRAIREENASAVDGMRMRRKAFFGRK